jgi:hypothetical protein
VAFIFAQPRPKEMPSCATICAFIHIEIGNLSDQFALMHAHFLGRMIGISRRNPGGRPEPDGENGLPYKLPQPSGFAGPAEAG